APDEAARQQSPINFRRNVGIGSLARDQVADENDRGRIDRALPIAGMTKRPSETEDIRTHEQEPGDVRRFKRARQSAHQLKLAALRAKFAKAHDLEMRDEPATCLVAGVEHRALEAQLSEPREEGEIWLFVDEHHADEGDVAGEPAQRIAEMIERR